MEQVYLITGASADVGIAFIEKLDLMACSPITVVAHYCSNNQRLMELQNRLQNILLRTIQADLSKREGPEKICTFLREESLPVTHVLHLAAEKLSYGKIKKWDDERVKREMQIQYFSFAAIMKEILPEMAKRKYGKICVMLSSCTLGTPPKFMCDYVATKSALLGYMRGAAVEYGEKGICINGISPNMMETKFLNNINEKIVEIAAESSALKRNTTVEETVNGILFLLSEQASYINGANLNLSGGDYMN